MNQHSVLRSRELIISFLDLYEKGRLKLEEATTGQLLDLELAIRVANFGSSSKSLNSMQDTVKGELARRSENT